CNHHPDRDRLEIEFWFQDLRFTQRSRQLLFVVQFFHRLLLVASSLRLSAAIYAVCNSVWSRTLQWISNIAAPCCESRACKTRFEHKPATDPSARLCRQGLRAVVHHCPA